MYKLQKQSTGLTNLSDCSKRVVITSGGAYETFMCATYYDGMLIGFIPNIMMVANPTVTFSGNLTYFAIKGKSNLVDNNPKVTVTYNGYCVITPTSSFNFTNGDTCLIQTNTDTVFVLEA